MHHLPLEAFPLITFDKIRYADTDRQGHVNNAVFATFLETGRVEFLYHPDFAILDESTSFVIVALHLNLKKEIKWPGRVEIGTGILKIGNSSITIYQKLFQNNQLMADAETTIVQVDNISGQSKPLTDQAKAVLQRWVIPSV
jgi:acyl-CoA thioester hydrolase